MINEKFSDNGESIYSFINNILIICPQCKKCANGFTNPTKIICCKCCFSREYKIYIYGNGTFCGEDLWLKTSSCSEKL